MSRPSTWDFRLRCTCASAATCLVLSAPIAGAEPADQPPAKPAESSPAASTADAQPAFDILEYRVLGNSALEATDIETAVYPYLGPNKSIKDVELARHALEDAYHKHGFGTVFVDIPEQQVDQGIVRLHVAEGKLRRVEVTGLMYFSGREIRKALPTASAGGVPNLPNLQKELTQVNSQTPDRTVVPVLKAGPYPGTVDLNLKAHDQLPFHGSVEFNDQYTPDTSPLRALFSLSYDNLFGRLDSLALQYQVAPKEVAQVNVLAASYTVHVNDEGGRLSFQFIDSNSNVATIGALSVIGKGKIYGTHWTQPLELTAPRSQTFTLGADYKDFAQNIQVDPTNVLETPVKYVNFSLGYAASWRQPVLQLSLDSTANFGVRGLASNAEDFAGKRFQASPNYFYLRSNASLGVRLPKDFTAIFRVGGQYAPEPLISNEQYTLGGVQSVRGYLEAEQLGDMGVKTTAQLGSPQLTLFAGNLHADSFIFYDFGRVSTLDALPSEPSEAELRSVGAGFNFTTFNHFTGNLTWAYPLAQTSLTRAHSSRLLFSVQSTW